MKTRALVLLATCLLLTSCKSSSTTESSATTLYQWDGFSMTVPSAWEQVDQLSLPTPKSGEVALALTSTEIKSGFANNLVILGEELNEEVTSAKYAALNYKLTSGKYMEVTKLDEKSITFPDTDISSLYIFEAKYNEQSTKQKFLQTAHICNKKVFLVTIGVALDTKDTAKYETLIKSFQCSSLWSAKK